MKLHMRIGIVSILFLMFFTHVQIGFGATEQKKSSPTPISTTKNSTENSSTAIPTTASIGATTPTLFPTSAQGITPTTFTFTIGLQGIGSGGDEANPTSVGNQNPQHTLRTLTVYVIDSTNTLIQTLTGTVQFQQTTGLFTGSVTTSNLPAGQYKILLLVPGFLKKWVSNQPISFVANTANTIPQVSLVNGDLNDDNTISVLDYNILASCFGDKLHITSCLSSNADINDDGVVDGSDYNLFLREWPAQNGDTYTNLAIPTPTPSSPGLTGVQSGITSTSIPTTYQKGIPATPPMGADPWLTYHDNLSILNEKYFMKMADFMHNVAFPIWDGTQKTMQQVGYNYVTIDDAWQGTRQGSNPLPPNPNFTNIGNSDPSIGLIAHVHSLGMKMGVYTDMGTAVCVPQTNGPQSGSSGYEMIDGAEFQQWGADYLKLDYCKVPTYSTAWFRNDLATWRKAVGPNILLYMNTQGNYAPWTWAIPDNSANTWRVNWPAQDAWSGTGGVIDTLDGSGSFLQQSHAAPYHWSDANYLAVGIKNLTLDESKSQFSMWAMVTSQLIAGNDILQMKQGDIASQVLFNTEVISVDQDSLVTQATKKLTISGVEVWTKPMANNTYAVAFLNTNNSPTSVTTTWAQLGIPSALSLRDLWQHKDLGVSTNSFTTTTIPAHGVQIIKAQ